LETPNAAYKLDVNGTLNVTSVLVGGTVITGSQFITSGTNICYTTGNVGIGIADPGTYRLNVTGNTKVTGT
jgi:hypothetical protein